VGNRTCVGDACADPEVEAVPARQCARCGIGELGEVADGEDYCSQDCAWDAGYDAGYADGVKAARGGEHE